MPRVVAAGVPKRIPLGRSGGLGSSGITCLLQLSLIAGAALTYGGNYKDYSLKARIAENRSAIIEDFKKGLG